MTDPDIESLTQRKPGGSKPALLNAAVAGGVTSIDLTSLAATGSSGCPGLQRPITLPRLVTALVERLCDNAVKPLSGLMILAQRCLRIEPLRGKDATVRPWARTPDNPQRFRMVLVKSSPVRVFSGD